MPSLVRKIAACLSLIACYIWYARSHFYRDPGSVFFDSARAYEEKYSHYRKTEARDFIELYGSGEVKLEKAGDNATLCMGLSSVKREKTQYLEYTLGSVLHGLTPEERADLHINVLIAETDPSTHSSWHQAWIPSAVDNMASYQVSAGEENRLRTLEETKAISEKGVYDYAYSLQQCYETGTPYIGIFEDDIILANGWLIRTLRALQQLPSPHEEDGGWLFMRLFNQERSTGWKHRNIGGNKEHWIVLGIGLAITALALLARSYSRSVREHLDLGTVLVVVLFLNPAAVVLFYQSGKASLMPPSPGVFAEGFGCCSQAMVFPRAQVPSLIEFLRQRRHGQVDLLLGTRAVKGGLTRYALYPVMAQHIGLDSARNTERDEAQAIWSMAFEDLDPGELEQEHLRMVDEYYRGEHGDW